MSGKETAIKFAVFEDVGLVTTQKCLQCSKTFKSEYELNQHMHEHANAEGVQKCSLCEKTFSTVKRLNSHSCSNILILKCQECGKTFNKNKNLQRHIGVHGKKDPHFVFDAESVIAMAKDVNIRYCTKL